VEKCDGDNGEEDVKKTRQHTSPKFTDSAISGREEEMEAASPPSLASPTHTLGGEKINAKQAKNSSLESASSAMSSKEKVEAVGNTPSPASSTTSAHKPGGIVVIKQKLQVPSSQVFGGNVSGKAVKKKREESLPACAQGPNSDLSNGKSMKKQQLQSTSLKVLPRFPNPPS
jgi:hypothetical protein